MGKSNFLDVSDRFGNQMMEENSSSISSGFLIIFALLPLFFLFFYLAQICHAPFSSPCFRLWFPALLFLMSSTLLALICSSLFSLTHTDPGFVLAFRSFLISFLSFSSLLSSLQIWLPSCLAASSPNYLIAQGKTACAAWSSGGKQSRFIYKTLPEFFGFQIVA